MIAGRAVARLVGGACGTASPVPRGAPEFLPHPKKGVGKERDVLCGANPRQVVPPSGVKKLNTSETDGAVVSVGNRSPPGHRTAAGHVTFRPPVTSCLRTRVRTHKEDSIGGRFVIHGLRRETNDES